MPRDPFLPAPTWSLSWRLLLAGLALSIGSWLLLGSDTPIPIVLPQLTLTVGTFLTVLAVRLRLRQETWEWPSRLESAAHVSLAGFAALAGYSAMKPDWTSGLMFFGALFILSLMGSALILLPSLARRVALSLLILFHFGGMVVCATSIDPPNASGPWVSKKLWTHVYRPYLSFMYLTNAYHFYSPDPGPPMLLWFAVMYDDGSYTWVKLPERANSPIGMHYQRHLAMPEHTFGALPRLPLTNAEWRVLNQHPPRRGSWEQIYFRREQASVLDFPNGKRRDPIPMVMDMDLVLQYREPNDFSKKMIGSVAKRVFKTAPPSRDDEGKVKPGVGVKSVKVYRVVHQILSPYELSQGMHPLEKTKHWPYFLGEFDSEGNLLDDMEPFLYWFLPIANVSKRYPNHGVQIRADIPAIRLRDGNPKEDMLLDCLEMHAAGHRRINVEEDKP